MMQFQIKDKIVQLETLGDGNYFLIINNKKIPFPIIDIISQWLQNKPLPQPSPPVDHANKFRQILHMAINAPDDFRCSAVCQSLIETIPDEDLVPNYRITSSDELDRFIKNRLLNAYNKLFHTTLTSEEISL